VLEVGGVVLVFFDIRADLARARRLATNPGGNYVPSTPGARAWIYEQIDELAIKRDPNGARALRIRQERHTKADRELQQVALSSARGQASLISEIVEALSGNVRRRVAGPVLIVLGVLIGTAANIAAHAGY
jgi:hypothetical protein